MPSQPTSPRADYIIELHLHEPPSYNEYMKATQTFLEMHQILLV